MRRASRPSVSNILRLCGEPNCLNDAVANFEYCEQHNHLMPRPMASPKLQPFAMTPRGRLCCIYAVRGGDVVKIGRATNVKSRLTSLQVGSPVPLELLGYTEHATQRLESLIHYCLRAHRSHGEWFHLTPEVWAVVNYIVANDERGLNGYVTRPAA